MTRIAKFFPALFFAWGFSGAALAQQEIPDLWGQRVHDEAQVLSAQTVSGLEQKLKMFEDSTSNQIAVLIVPSLEGEVIEQYALRVAEKWKLGRTDRDNGAVLVVSINDRKMRIEVGQGLEGPLPDAMCGRIIRNEMVPYFRRGDYDSGVTAAVDAIMMAIKGEYKNEDRVARRGGGSRSSLIVTILIIIILIRLFRRGGGGAAAAGWYLGSRNWGGGGGGGGFSGGGGSFGGGGASGSW